MDTNLDIPLGLTRRRKQPEPRAWPGVFPSRCLHREDAYVYPIASLSLFHPIKVPPAGEIVDSLVVRQARADGGGLDSSRSRGRLP
jgi:hypothetical protein